MQIKTVFSNPKTPKPQNPVVQHTQAENKSNYKSKL